MPNEEDQKDGEKRRFAASNADALDTTARHAPRTVPMETRGAERRNAGSVAVLGTTRRTAKARRSRASLAERKVTSKPTVNRRWQIAGTVDSLATSSATAKLKRMWGCASLASEPAITRMRVPIGSATTASKRDTSRTIAHSSMEKEAT